jgi:hypothetical protein
MKLIVATSSPRYSVAYHLEFRHRSLALVAQPMGFGPVKSHDAPDFATL